jgi:hypothetical protein
MKSRNTRTKGARKGGRDGELISQDTTNNATNLIRQPVGPRRRKMKTNSSMTMTESHSWRRERWGMMQREKRRCSRPPLLSPALGGGCYCCSWQEIASPDLHLRHPRRHCPEIHLRSSQI